MAVSAPVHKYADACMCNDIAGVKDVRIYPLRVVVHALSCPILELFSTMFCTHSRRTSPVNLAAHLTGSNWLSGL